MTTDKQDSREAFEAHIATLPVGAQQNIREAMDRGESHTADAFHAGWQASRKQALDGLEHVATVAKSPMNVSVGWIKDVPHNTQLFAFKELLK